LHLHTSPSWLPTLQLGYGTPEQSSSTARHARATGRRRKGKELNALSASATLKKFRTYDGNDTDVVSRIDPSLCDEHVKDQVYVSSDGAGVDA